MNYGSDICRQDICPYSSSPHLADLVDEHYLSNLSCSDLKVGSQPNTFFIHLLVQLFLCIILFSPISSLKQHNGETHSVYPPELGTTTTLDILETSDKVEDKYNLLHNMCKAVV
jgi:hypothetical protein